MLQSAGCRRSGFSSRRAPAQGLRPLGPRAGAQYLWCTGLAAPRREESSLDLGPNPCPLHWPVVSYPLHRQGSPHLLQGRLLALRPSFDPSAPSFGPSLCAICLALCRAVSALAPWADSTAVTVLSSRRRRKWSSNSYLVCVGGAGAGLRQHLVGGTD